LSGVPAVTISNTAYLVVSHTVVQNGPLEAFSVDHLTGSRFRAVSTSQCSHGLSAYSSVLNTFEDLHVTSALTYGIRLSTDSNGNTFIDATVAASGNNYSLAIGGGTVPTQAVGNLFIDTFLAFGDYIGLDVYNGPNSTLLNTTVVGSLDTSIIISDDAGVRLQNLLVFEDDYGPVFGNASVVIDQYICAQNATPESAGNSVRVGAVNITSDPGAGSIPYLLFPSSTPASVTFAAASPHFAFAATNDSVSLLPWQAWARYANTANPSPPRYPHGPCTNSVGPCMLWDLSLPMLNTIARNTTPLPAGVATHKWPAIGSSCSAYPDTIKVGSDCVTTYLKYARELLYDEIGNDNGLCESNEACLTSPNIGAYQGRGDPQLLQASFSSAPSPT
jgi:hypothetical protein